MELASCDFKLDVIVKVFAIIILSLLYWEN